MAGRKLGDATVDGKRRRNIVVAQQQSERFAIDLRSELGMLGERLELRAEKEGSIGSLAAIIERFLTQPVAGEGEAALFPVPQAEGEHARRALQCSAKPPCLDRSK